MAKTYLTILSGDTMKLWLAIIFALTLFAGVIYLEYSVWNECLQDNSFFYCLRMMNR